jgi:hypothetical protein
MWQQKAVASCTPDLRHPQVHSTIKQDLVTYTVALAREEGRLRACGRRTQPLLDLSERILRKAQSTVFTGHMYWENTLGHVKNKISPPEWICRRVK